MVRYSSMTARVIHTFTVLSILCAKQNLKQLSGTRMELKKYIQEHHGGNVTAYAKEYGTSRQQMDKWLKLDCSVIDGIIKRPVARHKK